MGLFKHCISLRYVQIKPTITSTVAWSPSVVTMVQFEFLFPCLLLIIDRQFILCKSTSYMYKEFQHLLLWLTVICMQLYMTSYSKMYNSSLPEPVSVLVLVLVTMTSWRITWAWVWVLTCDMLYVGLRQPHTLHTHRSFSLYIYENFQHLLQWLVVIKMQLQPDNALT